MAEPAEDHDQWLNDYTEALTQLYGEPRMTKITDIYKSSSNSLKAEDLRGNAVKVKISGWEIAEFDGKNGKEQKVVLSFENKEKTLVCNVTNSRIIASQLGDDIENWPGNTITLYPTKVDFGGEMVDAIRVRDIVPEMSDDDIPF